AHTLELQIARLTEAISEGGNLSSLVLALKSKDARRHEIHSLLAASKVRKAPPTSATLRARIHEELADWQGLLRRHPQGSRSILRTLLEGPIVCTPMPAKRGLAFTAPISFAPVVGSLVAPTRVASPRQSEEFCSLRSGGIIEIPTMRRGRPPKRSHP